MPAPWLPERVSHRRENLPARRVLGPEVSKEDDDAGRPNK
jgi:hypothetical protein